MFALKYFNNFLKVDFIVDIILFIQILRSFNQFNLKGLHFKTWISIVWFDKLEFIYAY